MRAAVLSSAILALAPTILALRLGAAPTLRVASSSRALDLSMCEPRALDVENVVVIGSGPSGYTAAIYAARASLKPVVFEGLTAGTPGGQLMGTTVIENFPGFRRGIGGPELMAEMREQAEWCGAEVITDDVISVDFSSRPFTVTSPELTLKTHAVIIATGSSARRLRIPSEDEFWGRGIASCAICDGATPMFREQELVVVGGGDSACEMATYLTRYASKVHQLHRGPEFGAASQAMADRVASSDKIEVHFNTEVVDVVPAAGAAAGESPIGGLTVKDTVSGEQRQIGARGLFYGIGHSPNTKLFADQGIELDEYKYIVTPPGAPETSVEGVFAAGDVQDMKWMQAITAAGSGCMAAMAAEQWLVENNLETQVAPPVEEHEDGDEAAVSAATAVVPGPSAVSVDAAPAAGSLQEKMNSIPGVALVKYVSPTCGACRALSPMLTRLLKKNYEADGVEVVEVDVDSQIDWAKEGGAQGTPTVQIWKAGALLQTIRGVEARQFYIDAIGEALGKVPSA